MDDNVELGDASIFELGEELGGGCDGGDVVADSVEVEKRGECVEGFAEGGDERDGRFRGVGDYEGFETFLDEVNRGGGADSYAVSESAGVGPGYCARTNRGSLR